MKESRLVTSLVAGVCLSFLLACGSGSGNSGTNGSGGGSTSGSIQSVNHVVMMIQENRSFDHYFGQLNQYRASQGLSTGVDGMPANASNPNFEQNGTVSAFHLTTQCSEDLSPFWDSEKVDINLNNPTSSTPLMNGFVWAAAHFARDENAAGVSPQYSDIEGHRAIGYYTSDDIGYYYFMATQFGTSDRFFAPVLTRSQPNHLYLYAATSQGYVYPPTAQLTAKTIFQSLDAAKVSWKIYETDPGANFLTYFTSASSEPAGNIVPATQFATDAANGTLPSVAFIEGGYNSGRDEHPPNPIQMGEAYVASLINALVQSQSWKDSVFFLIWDEAGGFYDHVPPASAVSPDGIAPVDLQPTDFPGDFTTTGFRIPMLVISPFAKKGYVSHTSADYTALLKFIETRWNLPNLTKRDAAQIDMTEFFDWTAPNANPPTPPPVNATALPCTVSKLQ